MSRAARLAIATHEAGHALVAAAVGMPIRHALARDGRGEVAPDTDAAAMLVARQNRRVPRRESRVADITAALAVIAFGGAGGAALDLRAATRPSAAWLRHAEAMRGCSRADLRGMFIATDRLRDLGVHGAETWEPIAAWIDATLARHAGTLWRLAKALHHQGRLTGPELDRLLEPVRADAVPFTALMHMAAAIADDPAMVWPVPAGAAGEGERDAAA